MLALFSSLSGFSTRVAIASSVAAPLARRAGSAAMIGSLFGGLMGGPVNLPLVSPEEACSGRTGHTEAVQVVYDPAKISFVDILRFMWEAHDPTCGMSQGNDVGTQYRSGWYWTDDEQKELT